MNQPFASEQRDDTSPGHSRIKLKLEQVKREPCEQQENQQVEASVTKRTHTVRAPCLIKTERPIRPNDSVAKAPTLRERLVDRKPPTVLRPKSRNYKKRRRDEEYAR